MSNENESKDLKLEDLEKPLTETEMKETTGGSNYFYTDPITGKQIIQKGSRSSN
ncbi:hypothetical protein [Paenibacillus eucommiae]|uniref:Bacteriocin-type signal sequence-containing protein n=1 Tax=Paenibacillus eucommiae TaxID=1355755 RepID=A0ABS4J6I8_9BACL|nr:hypothetical protein [Paenibacillus eucommiae]MBP1995469.1 hypothetical protein [Paenibacillus eucommiae]